GVTRFWRCSNIPPGVGFGLPLTTSVPTIFGARWGHRLAVTPVHLPGVPSVLHRFRDVLTGSRAAPSGDDALETADRDALRRQVEVPVDVRGRADRGMPHQLRDRLELLAIGQE